KTDTRSVGPYVKQLLTNLEQSVQFTVRRQPMSSPVDRDRGFESGFLQRGVCEPSVPLGLRDCRRGSIRRAARPAYLDSADLRVDPKGLLFRTRNGPVAAVGFRGTQPRVGADVDPHQLRRP